MRRILLLILLEGVVLSAAGQSSNWEVTVGHDNDYFVWYANMDRYYTYGLNITINHMPEKDLTERHLAKKIVPQIANAIHVFSAHLKAYTPDGAKTGDITFDRPHAGYAYLEYIINGALRDANIQLGLNAGIVGPAVKAGQIQNWFHEVKDDEYVDGWEYQVENFFGVHAVGLYNKSLFSASFLNLISESELSLGNVFLHGQQSARLIIGQFSGVNSSVIYGNRLRGNKDIEYFASVAGGVKLTGYNATIQGSIFSEDELPTRNLNQVAGIFQYGIHLNVKSFSISMIMTHGRGEVEQAYDHKVGQFRMGYIF